MGHGAPSLIRLPAVHGCARAISLAVSTNADGRDALLIAFCCSWYRWAACVAALVVRVSRLRPDGKGRDAKTPGASWGGGLGDYWNPVWRVRRPPKRRCPTRPRNTGLFLPTSGACLLQTHPAIPPPCTTRRTYIAETRPASVRTAS